MKLLLQFFELLFSVQITSAVFHVLGHWFLDGSDNDVSLHNGPTYTTSNGGAAGSYPAIKFTEERSYATTPAVNLTGKNFTIACWVKLDDVYGAHERRQAIYSDWYDPWQFMFFVKQGHLFFNYHIKTNKSSWKTVLLMGGQVTKGKWTHVAVTLDRVLRKIVLHVDALEVASASYGVNDAFHNPTRNTYTIGENGHPQNYQLYGEVMDLYVLDQALTEQQLRRLKDTKMESQMFHSTDIGFALQSHVFQTENHVTDSSQCMLLCRLHEECVSFNYNRGTQTCELNDAKKGSDPSNLKVGAEFVYFEQSTVQFLNN